MPSNTHNAGKWTESRFATFIKSALRSASQRWPPKFTALNNAKRGKRTNRSSGRIAEHYECAHCHNQFPAKEIQVDHINPVIDPSVGFVSWDEVIKRMFCEVEGYQVLCKACHLVKSNAEKRQAKERKDNAK